MFLKREWEAHLAEKGDRALAIIGTTEIIDSAGDRHDVCAYTTGKIFNNVKRAFEAYGKDMLVVIDGKQNECVRINK